jgi:hypothetical protein
VGTGVARFYIQGKTLTYPFNGFNMYKHDKNKQPKKKQTNLSDRYGRQKRSNAP